ncbi:MAG: UDP-N-acetylglucosamine pyrophosphorylase [Oscillospiraceae bacterium]|nr:UDP-N-acetylglucosamine pyrophosphorylase [Oscillospiraceae bacterium]
MFDNMRVCELFEPGRSLAWEYLKELEWPWDALKSVSDYIAKLGAGLDLSEYTAVADDIWIHKTARVAPTAFIGARTIIGANTEVRHCAFIRGNALVGENAVVGNSTELKNVILFDSAQAPHYNYVGDSILGYKAHMGAGAITSNVKGDSSLVSVAYGNERFKTELKKFGAVLGDYAEIGCNAVLNPGTVIGKNSNVYPLSMVRGFVPAGSIYKKQGEIAEKV